MSNKWGSGPEMFCTVFLFFSSGECIDWGSNTVSTIRASILLRVQKGMCITWLPSCIV